MTERKGFEPKPGQTMAQAAEEMMYRITGPKDLKVDAVKAMERFNAARTDRKPGGIPGTNGK